MIPSHQRRILVVEDSGVIRELLVYLFRSAGYQTTAAERADDAAGLARHYIPHAITLDCGQIASRQADVLRALAADPVHGLHTGRDHLREHRRLRPGRARTGRRRFRKPFVPDAVLRAVDELVRDSPA